MPDNKQNKPDDLPSKETGFYRFRQFLKDNLLIGLGIVGFSYFIIVTYLFVTSYSNTFGFNLPIDSKAFAEYGDHIAGIGAIFAFIFAFATFWRIEKATKKREFETTFFNMLTHFDSIISQIKVSNENRLQYLYPKNPYEVNFNGREALNVLSEDFLSVAVFETDINANIDKLLKQESTRIPYRWKELYDKNIGALPHYFRYYYTLVKFIMTSDKIIERKYYTDLLQATMSSSEMGLIFYNTFYNDKIYVQKGAQDFQKWLNDPLVSLLENIDEKSVLSKADIKAKCPKIKFKFELLTDKCQL